MSAGANVPIRVTMDTSDASSQMRVLNSGFTSLQSSAISTGRRAVSGFSGMLSSINNVYNAQQRLNVANINYTLTVREYGAGSIQAARSLDQLRVAQNGVSLANDQLIVRYVQFAMSVGPALYSTISKMVAASQGMTIQNYIETASWTAKAAAIGLTVALLTAGIGVAAALAAQAQVTNTINQTNNIYGGSSLSPGGVATYTSQSLAGAVTAQGG